jgi:Putative metallopeptidase
MIYAAAMNGLDVPIFGSAEDAADNFATYIILQLGENQARPLIVRAAWAWRAYLGDYKRNPVEPLRLAAFASNHGLPQEHYYNLLCLAVGAQRKVFADLEAYLPATRSPHCILEYRISEAAPCL